MSRRRRPGLPRHVWTSGSPSDYQGNQICLLPVPTQQGRERCLVGRPQTGNEGVPPQSRGPGQKFWPLQHQKSCFLYRATALFFFPFPFWGHFITFEQKGLLYFLFYVLWLLFLCLLIIITVIQETILFVKTSSITEKQPPGSPPWGITVISRLGGLISFDSDACAWRHRCINGFLCLS